MTRLRLTRSFWIMLVLMLLLASGPVPAAAPAAGDTVSPPSSPANGHNAPVLKSGFSFQFLPADEQGTVIIGQGHVFLVRLDDPDRELASARAKWDDQVIPCLPGTDRVKWIGVGGVDKDLKPGAYTLTLTVETTAGKRFKSEKKFTVIKTDFPSTQLTVAPDMVNIPPKMQEKMKEDRKAFGAVWAAPTYARLWEGPFLRPVPGVVTAPYGQIRLYNKELHGQHGGVDIAGPLGEPVHAAAAGKVALVHESYLEGNTIVLDHGGGLFTYYCHLSAFKVEKGQMVKKGDVVGLVGATGRVTGPHLHFGVRVQGVRVDGLSLLALDQWLE